MTKLSLLFIRAYQRSLGRFFALMSSCRYEPSCSHYGYEAIQRFGAFRAGASHWAGSAAASPSGGTGTTPCLSAG